MDAFLADEVSKKQYQLVVEKGEALQQKPWRAGVVYLLPRTTFVAEPLYQFGQVAIQSAQLASPVEPGILRRVAAFP